MLQRVGFNNLIELIRNNDTTNHGDKKTLSNIHYWIPDCLLPLKWDLKFFDDFHRPSTELREGNVFIRVCLSISQSVHRGDGAPCDHYSWSIGPHCTAPCPPSPGHQTWDLEAPPPLVAITRVLFKLVHLRTLPQPVLISGSETEKIGWHEIGCFPSQAFHCIACNKLGNSYRII